MQTMLSSLDAFQPAYEVYPATEMPFLQKQKQQALRTRPYRGLKILHNVPLTFEVLFKLEVLLAGGAELTVTSPDSVQPKPRVLEILKDAGVPVQLSHDFDDDFDLCLDYGAELLGQVIPRIGTAELTRTGAIRYGSQAITYPVISMDDSKIKVIEDVLGTGEAFVRAFQILTGEVIQAKRFMVVGCGKVGQGIVHALRRYTHNIVIVDSRAAVVKAAIAQGFEAILASHTTEVELQAARCFAVVAATGRDQIISQSFNSDAFRGRYLANMGGEDEFGDDFTPDEVLCHKQPINVALDHPTLVRYVDPVFFAHNMAIYLLRSTEWNAQVYSFPSGIADAIVSSWETYFQESLEAANLLKRT